MSVGISVSSDNNLPDLAGENPFCPCKREVSPHLCSWESPAFKAFHSREHGEMVQVRVQRCKLWQACLLLTCCYEYRHDTPQPVSLTEVYLNPGKLPCTARKKLCSILLYRYRTYLLSNVLLAGAYLVPSAPLLSRMLPFSWLWWCCPFCSE